MTDATESRLKDWGLLLLRVGVGGMFVFWHGWAKISGGPEKWAQIGGAMGNLGIHFAPVFWGFMAAFAEFAGGICVVLGLFTRPMAALLAFNMLVAALFHWSNPNMRPMMSYPIEMGIVMLSLVVMGAGRFSLGKLLSGGKKS
jgi:putative oxidoreductase